MNDAQKITEEIYNQTEGLKPIEAAALPPRIKWGEGFQSWDDEKKIEWLMKFGEAMNHAADQIQKERDNLGRMVEEKEAQLQQAKAGLDANNAMLQSEINNMNAYKQSVNASIAKLNARIRELERGNLD